MKRVIILIVTLIVIAIPVRALDISAPDAPESADPYLPRESTTFWEDLLYIFQKALSSLNPSIAQAVRLCISTIGVVLLTSVARNISVLSCKVVDLIAAVAIGALLLNPASSLITLGMQTVTAISEYGKLLLPVMTTALAATGGSTTSTALYTGTMLFNTMLTIGITELLIPLLYIYIALGIAKASIQETVIKKLHDFLKWLITWTLKISIYLFTGYLGVTGVIGGTVDAAAIKATKLAISGSVPVVGSIISDASETILVGAGIVKNSVGIYGMLAVIATWIGPFLQIGAQYIALKVTTAICGIFGSKQSVVTIENFTTAMGFLVAMTSTISVLLLVSIVCYIKGAG